MVLIFKTHFQVLALHVEGPAGFWNISMLMFKVKCSFFFLLKIIFHQGRNQINNEFEVFKNFAFEVF